MKKIELKDDDFRYKYGLHAKSTNKTLRQILLDQGYTEAQVRYMKINRQVVISPHNFSRKIKETEDIFVLDEPPATKVAKAKPSKRFANLEDEE